MSKLQAHAVELRTVVRTELDEALLDRLDLHREVWEPEGLMHADHIALVAKQMRVTCEQKDAVTGEMFTLECIFNNVRLRIASDSVRVFVQRQA